MTWHIPNPLSRFFKNASEMMGVTRVVSRMSSPNIMKIIIDFVKGVAIAAIIFFASHFVTSLFATMFYETTGDMSKFSMFLRRLSDRERITITWLATISAVIILVILKPFI